MGAGLLSWFYLLKKKRCITVWPFDGLFYLSACTVWASEWLSLLRLAQHMCLAVGHRSLPLFFPSANLTYVLVGLLAKAAKFAAKAS